MRVVVKTISVFVFFFVWLLTFSKGVKAQTFSLDPSSASKGVGEVFTVNLNIDTAGKEVAGADVKITYDEDIIEITKVEKGDFFTDEAHNIGTGTLYVAGLFSEQFKTRAGTGRVATLTLKGKAEGSDQLVFVCTPQTSDSNILDASANDIIVCSGIRNGTYTFSKETAAPAVTTTATSTPTLPVSGITQPTFFSLGLGALLAIIGLATVFNTKHGRQ